MFAVDIDQHPRLLAMAQVRRQQAGAFPIVAMDTDVGARCLGAETIALVEGNPLDPIRRLSMPRSAITASIRCSAAASTMSGSRQYCSYADPATQSSRHFLLLPRLQAGDNAAVYLLTVARPSGDRYCRLLGAHEEYDKGYF